MMRRLLTTPFMILALMLAGATAGWGQALRTKAPYAVLIDYGSGTVLFEKNADALMQPASTTKILTAEIVFRQLVEGRLKPDDTMIISPRAASEGSAASGGSSMFAEGIAGSQRAFAGLMTRRARELGMSRSRFANAWGEGGPGQKVTAREMARLAAHVIRTYPQFYGYFGEREFTWNNIRQPNRNPLLGMNIGADGLKTGHLASSGFGLVGSAVQNGRRLIVVINGLKTEQDRGSEARKLLEWGFAGNSTPTRKPCARATGSGCKHRQPATHG